MRSHVENVELCSFCALCVCVDVSKSLHNKLKHEQCFDKVGLCFVTYGQVMDLSAARHFCEIYPNKSVLPTISSDGRLQAFDLYLNEAQQVTKSQPLWLDIHKNSTRGSSVSMIVRTRCLHYQKLQKSKNYAHMHSL